MCVFVESRGNGNHLTGRDGQLGNFGGAIENKTLTQNILLTLFAVNGMHMCLFAWRKNTAWFCLFTCVELDEVC